MNTLLLILSIVLLALSILFLINTVSLSNYADLGSKKPPIGNEAVVYRSECSNYLESVVLGVQETRPEKCNPKNTKDFHNQYVKYRKMCLSVAGIVMIFSIVLFIMAIRL